MARALTFTTLVGRGDANFTSITSGVKEVHRKLVSIVAWVLHKVTKVVEVRSTVSKGKYGDCHLEILHNKQRAEKR